MRNIAVVLLAGLLPISVALAQSGNQTTDKPAPPGQLFPLKGADTGNSCNAHGADFAEVEGTEMCVKISGSVSLGAGGPGGAR
jgi:hypothetical protein